MLLKKRNFFLYFFSIGILVFLSSSEIGKKVYIESKKETNPNDKFLDAINSSCLDFHQDDKRFEKLYIEIPRSKSWSKNIFRALVSKSKGMILQRYKKRYSGYVFFSKNEDFCSLKSRIRLTGGRKEHIKIIDDKIISSLDINLKEGNINGITQFKLFLPETRNYDSEILTAYLLRKLGFISPRTAYIDLEINDRSNKMIIQENPAKELIEFNKLRESALLTTNNELLYSLRSKGYRLFDPYNSTIFPKLINHQWALRSKENHKISFNAMNKFLNVFQKSWSKDWDEHITFSDYLLSNGNKKTKSQLLEFRALLIAMGSEHALINNNRKFYFDPLTESFLPIYYDGDSKINENYILDKNKIKEIEKDLKFAFNEIDENNINSLIKKINKLDIDLVRNELSKLNLKLNKLDVDKIKINLLQNLKFLAINLKEREERKYLKGPHFYYKDLPDKFGIVFSSDNKEFLFCNIEKNNCFKKNLNKSKSIELISNNLEIDNVKYYFAGSNYRKYLLGKPSETNNKLNLFKNDIITIYYLGKPNIKLDNARKSINIETYNEKDKIIFLNSYLNDWSIDINSPLGSKSNIQSRNDENLLTALLTIKDSRFNNLNIEINGGLHEDGLNIINSSGKINQLIVSNSFQDAIDFDFSDIEINNVIVKNAGNDCIDLSSGKYNVNLFIAENCFDKGISVGESSKAIFEKINIKKIGIGFVAKDSSILNIKNGIIEDYKICAAGYRKKQEFNGSIIHTKHGICPEKKIQIQNKSYYFEK